MKSAPKGPTTTSFEMIKTKLKNLFSSQFRLNMLSGSFSAGLGVVVSAIKYPLYLHFLGYKDFGAWLLLSIALTFAQMGLLGIGPSITKLVAEEYGKNNSRVIQEYFTSAMTMVAIVGVALVTISIVFKWQIIALMGVESESTILISGLLVYMVVLSVGVLAYQVLNSLLAGIGRIDIANYSQTAIQILSILFSLPLLIGGKGIISLLLANVFSYISIFSFNFLQVNRIINIRILNPFFFSGMRLGKLIVFGLPMFSGSMLTMAVVPIVKIFITRSIGLEGVPIFELAYRLSMQIRSLFEVALRALMPEISKLLAKGHQIYYQRMKQITSTAYRFLFLIAIPVYAAFFITAGYIFELWLGSEFIPSIPSAFRIMLLSSFVSLLSIPRYYIFIGEGLVKRVFWAHTINSITTIFSLGIVTNLYSVVTVSIISWCFLVGSLLSTSWLFFLKSNTFEFSM